MDEFISFSSSIEVKISEIALTKTWLNSASDWKVLRGHNACLLYARTDGEAAYPSQLILQLPLVLLFNSQIGVGETMCTFRISFYHLRRVFDYFCCSKI